MECGAPHPGPSDVPHALLLQDACQLRQPSRIVRTDAWSVKSYENTQGPASLPAQRTGQEHSGVSALAVRQAACPAGTVFASATFAKKAKGDSRCQCQPRQDDDIDPCYEANLVLAQSLSSD